ncbi:MAG: S8 family peptidase [Deltaproteobacteria bacterium]|nr:S8 family peptidase [Myxococcales bacterium]MDP3217861.1 S8 family peptidase [Deltaproteobacteria bacterium]
MDAIRLKRFDERVRYGRPGRSETRQPDRVAHAAALREQLTAIASAQREAVAGRDPSLPALPAGVSLLIEPARDASHQPLLAGHEIPARWALEVTEERADGSLLSLVADPSATSLQRLLDAWEQDERDASGKALAGTAPLPLVERFRSINRATRMGDGLKEIDVLPDGQYLVDVELSAGGVTSGDGAGRRAAFTAYVREVGGTLPGDGRPLVADDYAAYRACLPGKAILDLVEHHPFVLLVDLPPEVERQGMELCQLTLDELPEIRRGGTDRAVVGVIDGAMIPAHPLLIAGVADLPHRSWVPQSDRVTASPTAARHGTAVVSVASLGSLRDALLRGATSIDAVRVCLARVLDEGNRIPDELDLPGQLQTIAEHLRDGARVQIINHSVASTRNFSRERMSVWAERIDHVAYDDGQPGYLFIVASGNIDGTGSPSLKQLQEWSDERRFPDWLRDDRCRLRNPAQAINALTVGGYVPEAATPFVHRERIGLEPVARDGWPSPVTRVGDGYLREVKPEVVEEAGNTYRDASGTLVMKRHLTDVAVASSDAMTGGQLVRFEVGTSFAAPRVAHLAARVFDALPGSSPDLVRALIVNSAQWPSQVRDRAHALKVYGYGVPRPERIFDVGAARSVATIEDRIAIGKVHYYRLPFPKHVFEGAPETLIRVSVTVAWRAKVRRTNLRYRGAMIEWEMAKRGESLEQLHARFADLRQDDDAEEGDAEVASEDAVIGDWGWNVGSNLRKRGTVQKDWHEAAAASYGDALVIGVMAKKVWMTDTEARKGAIRYAMTICVEAVGAGVSLHEEIKELVQAERVRARA